MNIMETIKGMDKKMRIMGIGVIAFILILTFTLVLNYTFSIETPNTFYGVKLNNAVVKSITLSNINMVEENGITKYEAKISTKEEKKINYIRIVFKDEDNKEIVSLIGYVGSSIKSGEERKIEASTDADLSKVKTIEYEIV